MARYVEIPPSALSQTALDNVLGEFVTRDGTDFVGDVDERIARVRERLCRGEVALVYDFESGTTQCVARRDLRADTRAGSDGE